MKIGIVGNGFVGSAVSYGFSEQCQVHDSEIRIYDKNPSFGSHAVQKIPYKILHLSFFGN